MTEAPPRVASTALASATVAIVVALAAALVAYAFFVTAGFSTRKLPDRGYYDKLSSAFLAGQVHILEAPSPQILSQANPYDFKTSRHLWKIWDASLYEGKYYFYWGPVPALFGAGAKLVAGRDIVVRDRDVVAVSAAVRLVVGAVLIALALRWLLPELSLWHGVPALLLWALANPSPYMLGRPGVYEGAIESAQSFLLLGLLLALVALRRAKASADALGLMALAGTAWALAVGCRVSVLLAVGVVILLTALANPAAPPWSWRRTALRTLVLGLPVAAMLLALGGYNYARFGSFSDFGTTYMLTKQQFSPQASFVLPNLHSYLLRPYAVSCEFPFLGAPFFASALTPEWARVGTGWIPQEPVVGMLVAIPGLVLGVLALGAAVVRLRRRHVEPARNARSAIFVWLVTSCGAIWLLAAVPALGVWTATMRYEGDVTPSALLLAFLGFWSALTMLRERGARVVAHALCALAVALWVYSVGVGVALGLQGGYYRAIKAHNPVLYTRMTKDWSLCDTP